MTRRLIVQSIGPEGDVFDRYMSLSAPVHERYADLCGADYWFEPGLMPGAPSPHWNRLALMLQAYGAHGYDEVVWLDADTLVVDMESNIFTETPDAPIQMVREYDTMHRGFGVDVWNSGVLVTDRRSVPMLEYVWQHADERLRKHHIDWYYEQNWIIDYCIAHQRDVVELSKRWNWMPWEGGVDVQEDEAAIKAWHGWPDEYRWIGFGQAYTEHHLERAL